MDTTSSPSPNWRTLISQMAELWGGVSFSAHDLDKQEKTIGTWKAVLDNNRHLLSPNVVPESFAASLHAQRCAVQSAPNRQENSPGLARTAISDEQNPDWWDERLKLKQKHFGVQELTERSLDRLHYVSKSTGACVEIFRDSALAMARSTDEALKRGEGLGAVQGMPLAHKDIFFRKNGPVTCGLGFSPSFSSSDDSSAVTLLHQHGALDLGRLHMTELAFDPSGVNESLGDCLNPWSSKHIPGGSSSGSATVVASRSVFAALGTDTGGSIRIPAVLCGVTGLKPTYDLVSRAGAMSLSWTNDHIGPLARSARDCALMMSVLAPDPLVCSPKPDGSSSAFVKGLSEPVNGLRVGVPEAFFRSGLSPQLQELLDSSLKKFESLGLTIKAVPDFDYASLNALGSLVTRAEAYSTFHRYLDACPEERLGSTTRMRLEEGLAIPAAAYLQALSLRTPLLRQFVQTVMAEVDVLHLPVCAIETPLIEDSRVGAVTHAFVLDSLTRLNRPFNYLGLPALALPCGFVDAASGNTKMPYGFQLVGAPYSDALLLRLGNAYQSVTDWHCHAPGMAS